MGIKTTLATAAAALLVLVVALVPGAQARPRPSLLTGLQARAKAADMTSLNWAGYVVPESGGHPITAVHTKFTVPVTHTVSVGGAALWTGIGGFGSPDLIQAGVSTGDVLNGTYAWFEILPAAENILVGDCKGDATCTVNTGDTVEVWIKNLGGDRWYMAMNDWNHWVWSTKLDYHSSESSAEWILEATSLIAVPMFVPFMDDVTFGRGNTFSLRGGQPQAIGTGHPVSTSMALGLIVPEAEPSALSPDGDRFRGCAFKSRCDAP